MRIQLVAAAALLIISAGAASAQTLTFEDIPDWNYAYSSGNAATTVTTGGFNITAAPFITSYSLSYDGNYYNDTAVNSMLLTYDQSNSQSVGVNSPSKLIYSITSDITLSKADNGRFSFEGLQVGAFGPTESVTIEGIRNGVVVDQALAISTNFYATTFTTSWSNLDSVVIKPTNGYNDSYSYNDYDYSTSFTGTNGQPANHFWLANIQVNSATPEASTWILMGLGCIGMMAFARRRQLAFDV